MRGNSLRFFKPPVFIKTFLVFCAIFAAQLFSSCKQLASFDPGVDGARVAVNKTFAAPTGVTATQGRKRIISLEWTPVSGARYYDIYCAKSATAEFAKVGETNKNSFDDKVGAGSTMYYKVCAVKSNGTQSAFSTIVKGTSLAQPVISDIDDKGDFSVTISWFMENACGVDGRSNYEDELKFEVFCEPKNGGSENNSQSKVVEAKKKSSSYECAFENLASSTEYQFYVVAYLDKDQQNTESSPKVDKTTLTLYEPFAPVVSASEGTSEKGVWLSFALPEMVKVNTVTKESQDEKVDELYPLYFKVSRVIEDSENYEDVCDLYYNGTELTETPVEYEKGGKPYEKDAQVKWFDDGEKLVGGVKYKYRIRSFVDTNYSKLVCPEGKEYTTKVGTKSEKATPAIGWKCALPSFKVKSPEKKYKEENGNNVEVLSYEFGFSAEWNDLGKAGDYKFAIKQNRRSLGAEDSAGEDTWCKKDDGSEFFGTLEEINSYKVKFGSNRGLDESEKGLYSYTLYIVSKSETEVDESNVLVKEAALDTIQVTEDVNLPEALLDVEGGYKNKVVLKISNFDDDVKYKITRTMLEGSSQEESKEKEFYLDDFHKCSDGTYEDNGVQDNCRYSYILTATNPSGAWAKSQSKEAETLGTPDVSFEKDKLSYDSVTISFYGVLAAEKYLVKLGEGDGFGGGETFEITKGDEEWNSETVSISPSTAKVVFAANKFTVTINKPYGYNDATKAGAPAKLTVTAHSDKYPAQDASALSEAVQVNVLGPALLETRVNTFDEAKEDYITVSWNKVEGAKGYLIRRVMYSDAAMQNVAVESDNITYYCDASGKGILADGVKVFGDRVTIDIVGNVFKLKDTYKEPDDVTDDYQNAQAKIAWGLPFRYVVLPVLENTDFGFKKGSLALESGKVAYDGLAPTDGAATWGYGLKVKAAKSESVKTQNVTWEKPFYGEELTPKVYRRKFANRDKNEWETMPDSIVNKKDCKITYSPSGEDRYYAWEYVVKYRNGTSNTIAPSYLEWFEDSEHDETRYDYGSKTKEKFNKGYLLAMDYSAKYGGEGTSKGHADYYSEDVEITSWDYSDRTLGPDKVELKVLSLDLASGWQTVGTFDSEIKSFTESVLSDTTVEANLKDKVIKLKPTEISNNKNGKGTTNGPLKILRSAKHYYGLDLSRAGVDDGFDCKNYEEYAYRQITDEELIKSTMLVVAEVIAATNFEEASQGTIDKVGQFIGLGGKASRVVNGVDGSFDWSQDSSSRFWWTFAGFKNGWTNFPSPECSKVMMGKSNIPHFITLNDNSPRTDNNDQRGKKNGGKLSFLCYHEHKSFTSSKKIPLLITSDIGLETYNATVNFASSDSEFAANITRPDYEGTEYSSNGDNIYYWNPANMNGNGYKGQNPAYDWWDN